MESKGHVFCKQEGFKLIFDSLCFFLSLINRIQIVLTSLKYFHGFINNDKK